MTPLRKTSLAAWLCLAAAAGTAPVAPALAQTAATKSIGAAKGGGKLLSRDELKACLTQQKDLATRKPQLESERAALDRERGELVKIEESLKADQAKLERLARTATEVGQRTKELQQQIADYNDRVAKFQMSNPSGPTAERQRRALDN
jgi:septal ring factor EnvC (AmiA/AmiB activator)